MDSLFVWVPDELKPIVYPLSWIVIIGFAVYLHQWYLRGYAPGFGPPTPRRERRRATPQAEGRGVVERPLDRPIEPQRPAPLVEAPQANGEELVLGAPVSVEEIATALNVAIIGPKNSGKTTLLQKLLSLRPGYVEALDPHNEPGKWPCTVVGGGERFDRIHDRLLAVYALMGQRYAASDRGERSQATYRTPQWRIGLAGDEWGGIVAELPDVRATKDRDAKMGAGSLLSKLIARGRKVGLGIITATHDDTAAQFGLGGEMGLVDCFDWLCYLGGAATGDTKIPAAVRRAAQQMERPAIALNTNHHTWHLILPYTPALDARHQATQPQDFTLLVALATPAPAAAAHGVLPPTPPAHGVLAGVPLPDAEKSLVYGVAHTDAHPEKPAEAAPKNDSTPVHRTPEPHESPVITPDEMRQIAEAVRLVEGGMSMTEALKRAFKTEKGSKNPRWQRARWLWDYIKQEQLEVPDEEAEELGLEERSIA